MIVHDQSRPVAHNHMIYKKRKSCRCASSYAINKTIKLFIETKQIRNMTILIPLMIRSRPTRYESQSAPPKPEQNVY